MAPAPYLRLMRADRPAGALLLLWPTLTALWIAAQGPPPLGLLVAFTAGTFLARAAGCVANDIVDRDIDGHVRRTRDRPLALGEVSLGAAVALLLALGAACVGIVLVLPPLAQGLAAVGAALALAYPFCKRWTHLPQAALGVAFSWGIPMAFAAATGAVGAHGWLLFAASFAWIVAYDTIYAMQDREDDIRIGVKSAAILFGRADRAVIGGLQILAIGALVGLGLAAGFIGAYYAGVAVMAVLFGYQQRLLRERRPADCGRAFGSNVWAGLGLFGGTVAEYAIGGPAAP